MSMNGMGETPRRRWLWALIALVILTPLGLVSAQQINRSKITPALGTSQVVTQGIAQMPGEDVVWRIVKRQAVPRAQAKLVKRDLGFVLASDEPILLTNATDGEPEDVASLAPGESYMIPDGIRQARASFTDEPVDYLSLELVPAADAENVGSAELLFVSDAFTAPQGKRDLDLVRNFLALGKSGLIPDTGESVAILATDGAIDIVPGGGEKIRLNAGESALLPAGELTIEAVNAGSLSGDLPVALMTNNLQQENDEGAAYVVAVIGEEIPPPPTPTAVTVVIPTPTATAEAAGSISLLVYNCPEGMTIENMVGDACDPAEGVFDFGLTTPSGNFLTLADAAGTDAGLTWSGLEMGTFTLSETQLPNGFDSYYIPGSAGVASNGDGTFSVTLDPGAPDLQLAVYNFQPELTGSITVQVYGCAASMTPNNFSPTGCTPMTSGWDFALFSDGFPNGLYSGDAAAFPAGLTWSGLPLNTYGLAETLKPEGYDAYIVPDSNASSDYGDGIAITPGQPDYTVSVYYFAEQGPVLTIG
jgi:hypothetical protein